MKVKIGIEDKIVFFTNTFGSWITAALFIDDAPLISIYFIINFFCFISSKMFNSLALDTKKEARRKK